MPAATVVKGEEIPVKLISVEIEELSLNVTLSRNIPGCALPKEALLLNLNRNRILSVAPKKSS